MIDHGLLKKKIFLEAMVFKLCLILSTWQLATIIRKIRMIIFKEFTPTTSLEIFFTSPPSNTLLPTPLTETITLSIKMKKMVTTNPNLILSLLLLMHASLIKLSSHNSISTLIHAKDLRKWLLKDLETTWLDRLGEYLIFKPSLSD